tara:strand:+ start:1007 stop:1261 length:255 start_codon:yes stop_codon:yes gene_type:complete
MNRLSGGTTGLYLNRIEDDVIDNTSELFKRENKEKEIQNKEKVTSSFILSNDLSKVLKKNRELYAYIEHLENENKILKEKLNIK